MRYAVREIAPNKVGPVFTSPRSTRPSPRSSPGPVRISWQANWDRDNENLTYKLIRDGITAAPIYTVNQLSSEWKRPMMGYTDTGLVPGQQYRYRLFVSDPYGNEARSDTVYVTVSADGTMSTYAQGVLDDGAVNYWRLGETPATTVNDWAGFNSATAGAGVTGGQTGAINGDTNPASTFNGTTTGFAVVERLAAGAGHVHGRGLVQHHLDRRRQDHRLRQCQHRQQRQLRPARLRRQRRPDHLRRLLRRASAPSRPRAATGTASGTTSWRASAPAAWRCTSTG